MTEKQALRALAPLSAYYPGRVTPVTVRAWAYEIREFEPEDVDAAVRSMSRAQPHPSLAELRGECSRIARRRREIEADKQLPSVVMTEERAARNLAKIREIAGAIGVPMKKTDESDCSDDSSSCA